MKQSEWYSKAESGEMSEPELQHVSTIDVTDFPKLENLGSGLIDSTIKGPQDMVKEMKNWLRTGISPDGTRMMTDESVNWVHDVYHGTRVNDTNFEALPKGSQTDYYYWTCPYQSHIGEIQMVMMKAQVNFSDGTHMPADRLEQRMRRSERLAQLAEKYKQHKEKKREEFIKERAFKQHRNHPLRKKGIYTKYFWQGDEEQEGNTNENEALQEPQQEAQQVSPDDNQG